MVMGSESHALLVVTDVNGIELASSESDVFQRTFDGNADELRHISAAMTVFCEVAEQ